MCSCQYQDSHPRSPTITALQGLTPANVSHSGKPYGTAKYPSHGRGHWFESSIAHSLKTLPGQWITREPKGSFFLSCVRLEAKAEAELFQERKQALIRLGFFASRSNSQGLGGAGSTLRGSKTEASSSENKKAPCGGPVGLVGFTPPRTKAGAVRRLAGLARRPTPSSPLVLPSPASSVAGRCTDRGPNGDSGRLAGPAQASGGSPLPAPAQCGLRELPGGPAHRWG